MKKILNLVLCGLMIGTMVAKGKDDSVTGSEERATRSLNLQNVLFLLTVNPRTRLVTHVQLFPHNQNRISTQGSSVPRQTPRSAGSFRTTHVIRQRLDFTNPPTLEEQDAQRGQVLELLRRRSAIRRFDPLTALIANSLVPAAEQRTPVSDVEEEQEGE